ncbi:hypothetical protein [Bartonella florencae]|uniref:hypothetical protein n=1 Tax=Bartonella florencae TaxID=928210 RepID=UPI0002DBADF9|nr:hypothetical protein [Bartonella florencae]
MFKIFKNRVYSLFFTVFILFFVQTVEGNASFVKDQFQRGGILATREKTVVIEAVDELLAHKFEGESAFDFVKVKRRSVFLSFWDGLGMITFIAALYSFYILGMYCSIFCFF